MGKSEKLNNIYNEAYYEHGSYRGYTRWYFKIYHFFKFFPAGFFCRFFLGTKTILDVGCADGMSLWVFRNIFGIEAYGIETSRWAIDHAVPSMRRFIIIGDIEDGAAKLPREHFDVVTSFDTFEHLHPENLSPAFRKIFSLTDTLFCSIYVLDELAAFVQNIFGITHKCHYSEHSSSWWLDFFASQGAMATRIP